LYEAGFLTFRVDLRVPALDGLVSFLIFLTPVGFSDGFGFVLCFFFFFFPGDFLMRTILVGPGDFIGITSLFGEPGLI
jgi:hypothetical protein